jgi:uncharacterized protein (TIGR03545 family)
MRKKFVYFVLVPFIIVCIILYFFLDRWVESGIEYAGEQIVGAKVEIDDLDLTLSPLGAKFKRLQVTDPHDGWKNLFETGKVQFAVDFGQLLRGKYIIETMEMNNLILGTRRSTNGAIPKPPKKVKEEPSEPSAASKFLAERQQQVMQSFDIEKIKKNLKLDTLLNPANLATIRLLDSLKEQIDGAEVQWNTTLAEFEQSKQKLSDIETTVKKIDVNAIKDIKDATEALNSAKIALATAQEVKTTFTERKKALTASVDDFSHSIASVDNVVKEDYERILSAAHLPDVSMKGISETLLGKEMLSEAAQYLHYAEIARSAIKNSSSKPEKEKPKRLEGQTIHFPVERAYPKLWIKKIRISGGTDQHQDPDFFYAKGEVKNISNDQRITHVPLTVDLLATRGNEVTLTMNFLFDRTRQASYDRYAVQLAGLPVATMKIGGADFLPSKITNARMDASVTVEIPDQGFESKAKVLFYNFDIVFDQSPSTMVERIVYNVLSPIDKLSALIRMWKNEQKFDIAFETDLDDKLITGMKQAIGDELARIQNDLRNKLNVTVAEKRREVEKLYTEKREMVLAKAQEYETTVNEKLTFIENKKKELEQRIEDEKNKQTGAVKKKAEDQLKNLLKGK